MYDDIETIRAIATEVRARVSDAAMRCGGSTWGYWDSTLGGLCGVASDLLVRAFAARGITATLVYGKFHCNDWTSGGFHCWVECNGYVVDITTSQFGEQFPTVFITSVLSLSARGQYRGTYLAFARGDAAYAHITQDKWPSDATPGALDQWLPPEWIASLVSERRTRTTP